MSKKTRKIISFFMFLCFSIALIEPFKVQAATIPYAELKIDKDGLKKVYDTLFNESLVKENVKTISKDEAKNHPVAMVKLENGKVAYYVDGKPYYPLAVETGWWDTRVDNNGKMSYNDPSDVGDDFKDITDEEWNSYFSDMNNMGFNTVQLMTYWRDWEPVQGQYDFTFLNHVTDLAAQNGLKTELILFFHSQTDNIPRVMDKFWGYDMDNQEINGKEYSLSMQWGNSLTSAEDIRDYRDRYNQAGIENFIEYWHPEVFKGVTNALEALGRNFKDSSNIIGYQIGNEEGFNFYVDGGDDKNPYYKEIKKMYESDENNAGKNTDTFRADLINNLWKAFSNALHKGDPYKPTTTNIQSGHTEKQGIMYGDFSNDGTTIDFYKSVDMIGSMFYGSAASLYPNLDKVYNTYKTEGIENTYATGFPILFPTEISGTMNDGSVAKQITAQTIARGGQGIGIYCYGEFYDNFEKNGMKYPKPVLGTIETMLQILKDNMDIIHSGVPVTKDLTNNIFMEMKSNENIQGKPTLNVLEGIDGKGLGVLHFPGNSNAGNSSPANTNRTITMALSAKEPGNYKVNIAKTDGTVDVKIVNVQEATGEAEFTIDTTGLDVSYITAEKTDETEIGEGTLESIEIYGKITKIEYTLNEEFDPTTIKIRAKYSNGLVKLLNGENEIQFAGFDSEIVGEKTVTAQYQGKEVSFKVFVKESDYYTNMREVASSQLELLFDGAIDNGDSGNFKAEATDLEKMRSGDAFIEYNFKEKVQLSGIDMWTNYGADQGIKKFKVTTLNENGEWVFVKDEDGVLDKEFTLNWTTKVETCEKLGVTFNPVTTSKVRIYVTDVGNTWGSKFAMREIKFTKTKPNVVLEGIEVKAPNKTEYFIGEELNTQGMKVIAKYSDGTSEVLDLENINISGFTSDVVGEKEITVSYTEKEIIKKATFKINVKEIPYLSNFDLFEGYSLDYLFDGKIEGGTSVSFKADNTNLDKMEKEEGWIQYNFDNKVQLNGIDMWTNYGSQQGILTFKIATLDENGNWLFIEDKNDLEKTNGVGKTFTLKWETKVNECEKQGVTFEPVNTDKVRIYVLSVAHDWNEDITGINKFAMREIKFNTEEISVPAPVLDGIEVKLPNKKEYVVGEDLNLEGMQVIANYSDGSKEDVTGKVEVTGYNGKLAGEQIITVKYKEKIAEFKVIVKEANLPEEIVLTGIEVVAPTKIEYKVGEKLNLEGMKVIAKYSNGTVKDIALDNLLISDLDSTTVGEKIITVKYEGKMAEFKVMVKSEEGSQSKPSDNNKPSDNDKPLGDNNASNESADTDGKDNINLPATGGSSPVAIGVLGTIISLAGIFMIKRKN